jgi:3alpha(or 20beta)-hydroxysteroid dehydrogenase
MGKLDQSVAIISGGARGMGASHARGLVAEGAKVVVGDILETEGMALARDLGASCRFVPLDVTKEEDWSRAVKLAEETFGGIDVLINNAGVVSWHSVEDTTPEDFRRIVDINLTGVFLGMRAVIPAMRRVGHGVIVNISSTAGLMGYASTAAYVASKWGVRGITKAAALELGQDGIRVVSVHPGAIRSPMAAEVREDAFKYQPVSRIGEEHEVTKLIVYLVADATYSTGSEFVIDGGAVLMGPGRPTKRFRT